MIDPIPHPFRERRSIRWLTLGLVVALLPLTGCSVMNGGLLSNQWEHSLESTLEKNTDGTTKADDEGKHAKVELMLASAIATENQGQIDQAMATYRQALHFEENEVALYRLALLHERRGESKQAQELFQRAVAKNPKSPELLCDAGYSAHLAGDRSLAEQQLRRSIELSPGSPRAHNNLGVVLASQGDFDAAIASFERGGCTAADANSNVGYACLLESRWNDAEKFFDKARSLSSTSAHANQGLKIAKKMKSASQKQHVPNTVENSEVSE